MSKIFFRHIEEKVKVRKHILLLETFYKDVLNQNIELHFIFGQLPKSLPRSTQLTTASWSSGSHSDYKAIEFESRKGKCLCDEHEQFVPK